MRPHATGNRRLAALFWVLSCATLLIWSHLPGYIPGWDLRVYQTAIHYLQAGQDPYAAGVAIQRAFHATLAQHPNAPPPFTYVYSPITLPVLRLVGLLPFLLSGTLYWAAYVAGTLAAIWAGMQAVEPEEYPLFLLLAPAAIFFPALLQHDVIFSGNIAYICYGLVLPAAVLGWRRGQWGWFFAATLLVSCLKAPLLYLLAIPVLTARKQWLSTCLTGLAGTALFLIQPFIWPSLFAHYLDAVELQFSFNHDFSSSPAGLLADALYDVIPYRTTSLVFYLFTSILFGGLLLHLRRRYMEGRFSLRQWIPVMLLGVALLNPRIMEYDVAPLSIPMALVAWRVCGRTGTPRRTLFAMIAFFLVANYCGAMTWRPSACMLLIVLFVAGAWNLLTDPGLRTTAAAAEPTADSAHLLPALYPLLRSRLGFS